MPTSGACCSSEQTAGIGGKPPLVNREAVSPRANFVGQTVKFTRALWRGPRARRPRRAGQARSPCAHSPCGQTTAHSRRSGRRVFRQVTGRAAARQAFDHRIRENRGQCRASYIPSLAWTNSLSRILVSCVRTTEIGEECESGFELLVPLQCSSHPEPLRDLSLRTGSLRDLPFRTDLAPDSRAGCCGPGRDASRSAAYGSTPRLRERAVSGA